MDLINILGGFIDNIGEIREVLELIKGILDHDIVQMITNLVAPVIEIVMSLIG
ncbi:MAG: hypothetical protein GX345_03150 [Clostridiales bacterium]|nr:hypothetical protein [Clostridiales bacterium]